MANTTAQDQARHTFRKVNAMVVEFVRELGGWEWLPEGFNVSSAGWHEAEAKIEAGVAAKDATATLDACLAYEERAAAYLDAWRRMAGQKKAA